MNESISVSVSEQVTVSGAAGDSSGRIYWVGGSKGGVGKSMITLATVDHLLEQGANVLLVECDTSNPDVGKAYKEEVETELIDLDEADGWIHLVNTCDRRRDSVVVINTAARNNLAVKQYGSTLDSSQPGGAREQARCALGDRRRPEGGRARRAQWVLRRGEKVRALQWIQDPRRGGEPRGQVDNAPRPRRSRGW